MAELRRHPDSANHPTREQDAGHVKRSRKTYSFIAAVVALVTLIVILHLAGVVGPGTN